MKFSFDAASCKITECSDDEVKYLSLVERELTYKDKSAAFQRDSKGRNDVDVMVCVFDQKAQSFATGLLPRVVALLTKQKVNVVLDNHIPRCEPTELTHQSNREYQTELIRLMLERRRGIIKAPTAAGKTYVLCQFLKHFPNAQVLISVPGQDLLRQMAETLEQELGEGVGRVGAGFNKWKRITVGVINSLSKAAKERPDLLAGMEVWVVDECHNCANSYYEAVSEACVNTDYRIGLSATPWRGKGDDLVMEGILGCRIGEVTETALADQGFILKPTYVTIPIPDPKLIYPYAVLKPGQPGVVKHYNRPDGRPEQDDVYRMTLAEYEPRNRLVCEAAELLYSSAMKGSGVILVEWISHGELLQQMLSQRGLSVPFIHGQSKKKERQQTIQQLADGSLRLAIASMILKEGTNMPHLCFGILAAGGASSSRMLQQVGRLLRTAPGKSKPLLVDFADQEHYHLSHHSNARIRTMQRTYPGCHASINNLLELIPILNQLSQGNSTQ